MNRQALLIAMAALLWFAPLQAQTAAELLEKGIYTQETVGDVDAAMKIYRQIVGTASESRAYVAQAHYRLGVCLRAKGNRPEAEKEFAIVTEQYADQTELAAKAKQQLAGEFKLLAAPWNDGEVLEYEMRMGKSTVLGVQVLSVEAGVAEGRPAWLMKSATCLAASQTQFSRVSAERDTMRPISSAWRVPLLGDAKAAYQEKTAVIETKDKPPRTIELSTRSFDNEEWLWLLRRLPFATGYRTSLESVAIITGGQVPITVEVIGQEDVETPAGKFRTWKVQLQPVNQTFWFATDGERPMVKYEAMTLTAQLTTRRRIDGAPVQYKDPNYGFTLSAPAGWLFKKYEAVGQDPPVWAYAPDASGAMSVVVSKASAPAANVETALRAQADEMVQGLSKSLKDFTVRADSWSTTRIADQPAIRFIADFSLLDHKTIHYVTIVQGESLRIRFQSQADADLFPSFRAAADPVMESLKFQ
jgi:hypothetical protein